MPLLLEVKVDGDIWRWVPALRSALADYAGPFGVMSFDPRVPRLLKTNLPEVRRGLVVRDRLPPLRRRLASLARRPAIPRGRSRGARQALGRARAPADAGLQLDDPHAAEQRSKPQVHADALIWEADGRP